LRIATAKTDHLLAWAVYDETQALFLAGPARPRLHTALIQLAPEYGRPEYLLQEKVAEHPE